MADTNEFIRNMLQMIAIRNQAEDAARRFEIDDRNSAFAALGQLTNTLRSTANPEAQGPIVESFIRQYLPDMEEGSFHSLIAGLQPTMEATTVAEARGGLAGMGPERRGRNQEQAATVATTGMDSGRAETSSFQGRVMSPLANPRSEAERTVATMFGNAFLTRSLAGLTPGQFSVDQALHNLPGESLTSAARIGAQLEPGAEAQLGASTARRGQDMTYAIGQQSNQVQMAQIEQQGAIAMLNAGIQLQGLQQQAAAGQSMTPAQLIDLQQYQSGLVEMLRKGGMSPWMKHQVATQLDNANQLLSQHGLQAPNLDPAAIAGGPQIGHPDLFPMYPTPQQQQQQIQGAQQFMPQPLFPRP